MMKRYTRALALLLCLAFLFLSNGCNEVISATLPSNNVSQTQKGDKESGTNSSETQDNDSENGSSANQNGSDNDQSPDYKDPFEDDTPPPETPFITLSHVPLESNMGDLILVNKNHTFDAKLVETDLVRIKSAITDPVLSSEIVVAKYEMYLTAKMVDALARLSHDMQTELACDRNIHIYSAYRDAAYQQGIIDDYLNDPKYGQSYVDNYVAPVGASEHHTGLAVDINFYTENDGSYRFDNSAVAAEYAWILEHAHEYGLIWRYTDEKKEYTGYSEEIWHFRYVGTPHAEYMKQNNLCFEEYHALIAKATFDNPLVITTSDNTVYSIYADMPRDGLQVPQSLTYTVSGSNCGYYIVTVEGSYTGAGIIYADSSDQVELQLAPDMGEKYLSRLTFLADSQIDSLKNSVQLPQKASVWSSATQNKLNFRLINTLAVMVDTQESDRYWVSHTIDKTVEHFKPDILVLCLGLDGGINREYALTDSECAEIWRTLITSILNASPDTIVVLQSVLPLGVNAPDEYIYTTNTGITQFNSTMLHVATELHAETGRVFFLDTASAMKDQAGNLDAAYSDDGVTLNEEGIAAMMQYIRTHPYVD